MSELSGKVAIVTGAGRGLGRVEAIQLARQGARVIINEIGLPAAREAAESAREEIRAFGGEAITVYGDCADWNDSEALFKTAIDSFGDVNIVEPNALIGFAGPRVIESTLRTTLPEGFQRSEFLQDHGMVDRIVPRTEMKSTLSAVLRHLSGGRA